MENLLYKALEGVKSNKNYAFATIIESTPKGTPRKSGAKMLVFSDGTSWGTIGGGRNEKAVIADALKAIASKKTSLNTYTYFGRQGESVCGGQIKVFIEPFYPPLKLIICGAGHIALPLSFIAKMSGFKVTVIDNRKAFANKKRFMHVDHVIVGPHAKKLKAQDINPNVYIAIVTQGNEFDFECLKAVVNSNAGYIGVISSKLKKIKFFDRLKKEGVKESALKRIHIPMGIDVGAQTPEEIAVSVMAEMTAVKNNDLLGTSKFDIKSASA